MSNSNDQTEGRAKSTALRVHVRRYVSFGTPVVALLVSVAALAVSISQTKQTQQAVQDARRTTLVLERIGACGELDRHVEMIMSARMKRGPDGIELSARDYFQNSYLDIKNVSRRINLVGPDDVRSVANALVEDVSKYAAFEDQEHRKIALKTHEELVSVCREYLRGYEVGLRSD